MTTRKWVHFARFLFGVAKCPPLKVLLYIAREFLPTLSASIQVLGGLNLYLRDFLKSYNECFA